jgi:hypothetical protein
MKSQYDNDIMSSFYLWFDHTLLDKGEAFTNYGTKLYPVSSLFQGYNTYGSPFRQFVSDESIPNANIMSGVYIDNAFTYRGTSEFTGINYGMGQAYFTAAQSEGTVVSGNYAVKDFNVYMTNEVEEKLLFETQFNLSNRTDQAPTGLPPSSKTYPSVFVKNVGSINEPFAFGGTDMTTSDVRAIVLADSQFKLDAISSIFRDMAKTTMSIIPQDKQPYNILGDFKDEADIYNYNDLVASSPFEQVYIREVTVSKIGGVSYSQLSNLNPNVFSALIDFELEQPRNPRL